MNHNQPLPFTDLEIERLQSAAAYLPEARRANFLRSVANVLGDTSEWSVADFERAICKTLSMFGVSAPRPKYQYARR